MGFLLRAAKLSDVICSVELELSPTGTEAGPEGCICWLKDGGEIPVEAGPEGCICWRKDGGGIPMKTGPEGCICWRKDGGGIPMEAGPDS